MKPWIYGIDNFDELTLSEMVGNVPVGFIYSITNTNNGKVYIGRKSFLTTRKVGIGKKAIANMVDKRGSKKKTIVNQSNWEVYTGSNKQLNEDISSGNNVRREIIKLCYTKKQMTYWEMFFQFQYDVLREESYNDNILGKFFRSDLLTD